MVAGCQFTTDLLGPPISLHFQSFTREIPINYTSKATLQSLPRRLDVSHVFYAPASGRPYQDVKRSFRRACRKAGIKDFKFHDLRHYFASHLVMAGVDLTQ